MLPSQLQEGQDLTKEFGTQTVHIIREYDKLSCVIFQTQEHPDNIRDEQAFQASMLNVYFQNDELYDQFWQGLS